MAVTPAVLVAAPESRGLRYGLLTAANGPLLLPQPHGLAGGVQYEPVTCGFARIWPADCPEPRDGDEETKSFDDADPLVEAQPFVVYATYKCGSAGYTPAELETKVRRRLANGEQTAAEQGMAAVLNAAATPLVAPDPTDIASVIGELQQWLYGSDAGQQQYGNVGFLHVPVRFESYLNKCGLLEKDGNVYRTRMGTVVVFGGGYPDDGTIWISGNTTVWRAEDVHVPDVVQSLDREKNEYRIIAEREYAVAFDCVAASAVFTPEVAPS